MDQAADDHMPQPERDRRAKHDEDEREEDPSGTADEGHRRSWPAERSQPCAGHGSQRSGRSDR